MHNVLHPILFGLIIFFSPLSAYAQMDYQGGSNVRLLYGENFDPADEDLITLTPEHAGSYGALEHFGFIDLYYETNTDDISAHLEWYPKASLSRISGQNIGAGPLNDVLLGAGVNADFNEGENSWVWLAGPVWQFSIPGFDSFQIETYYYKQTDYAGNEYEGTYQITPSWDIMLPLSEPLQFRLTGFVDFIGDRGPGEHQIITQPEFLLDIGNFWDNPGVVYAGTEWRYWYNKGGEEGVTESVFQLELRVDF